MESRAEVCCWEELNCQKAEVQAHYKKEKDTSLWIVESLKKQIANYAAVGNIATKKLKPVHHETKKISIGESKKKKKVLNNCNNNNITLDYDNISNVTTLLKDTDNNNNSALHSVNTNNVIQTKKTTLQPNLIIMLLHPDEIHSIINPK